MACAHHDESYLQGTFLLLDPSIDLPSSSKELDQHLLPDMRDGIQVDMVKRLATILAVALSFDLWMSRKTEDILSLEAHYVDRNWKWKTIHLGLINCTNGTSGHEVRMCGATHGATLFTIFHSSERVYY